MTRQRVLILLVLLALGTAAAYAWWRTRGNDEGLRLSGNVDIREVNLSFRVGGRLQRLSVDEGARVHAGEVLGELDAAPFRIALAQAQANRAALRAQQTLYHEGYRKEDIEQARANLQAAQAAQSNAERLYERQQQLAGTGASPRHVLDDARAQRDQAAAQTEAARQRLAELTRGLIEGYAAASAPVVAVSNELGFGLVPPDPGSRRFRDELGRLNQAMAAVADEVWLVVAGLPLRLK